MDKAKEIKISADDNDIRLDRWFKRHYPTLPHGKLQQLLRKGAVKIDRASAKASHHIKTGQTLRIPVFSTKERQERKPIALNKNQRDDLLKNVLYKNDRLIVFNKPSGLAVQGGTKTSKHLDGLLDGLKFDAKERPRLVHRLDKDTSGVLLLARKVSAAAELTRYFRLQKIEKTYWALLSGVPPRAEGIIESEIEGRQAITSYRLLDQAGKKLSWIEFSPRTGRKHQLRIHADLMGVPIVGDQRYGRELILFGEKPPLHLHARGLTLPTGENFTAPLPPHMEATWAKLGFMLDF
jgi:23S rRNA pseudouridine955/2504/2580 synthase